MYIFAEDKDRTGGNPFGQIDRQKEASKQDEQNGQSLQPAKEPERDGGGRRDVNHCEKGRGYSSISVSLFY